MLPLLNLSLCSSVVLAQDTPAPVQPPARGARWALLVGVDSYIDEDIHDLRYAGRDAREVARTLIESGAYPSDHVVVMTPDHPNPALRPTRTHLLEQIRQLQLHPDAEGILFYFSGHGYRVELAGAPANVLLPMDTSLRVPAQTAIPIDEVLATLDQADVDQRIAIFDACRDDLSVAKSAGSGSGWVLPSYQGEGARVLFCTRDGEVSYELEDSQLGACTSVLVAGLQGAADVGRDGVVGAQELYLYLDEQLQRLDLPTPQRPAVAGELSGPDLAVAPIPAVPDAPPPVCPSDRRGAEDLVQAALARCADPSEAALIQASRQARDLVACLGEPMSPHLAVDLYRLEAVVSHRLADPAATVAWLRAAHEARPEQDLRLGLPEACWMPDEMALALAAPRSRLTPLEVPARIHYLQDGVVAEARAEDRPLLGQAVNPDDTVQWTRLVLPGEPLPPIGPPTAVMVRRRQGTQLAWGAAGGGLASAGLMGGAFWAQAKAEAEAACWREAPACDTETEAVEPWKNLANGLFIAAQVGAGVSVSAAGVGLWMRR